MCSSEGCREDKMSLEKIHLSTLLKILYSPDNKQRAELLKDLNQQAKKEAGVVSSGGGDFHIPFWSDAKDHVVGIADLREQTKFRVGQNYRRKRLYPLLTTGFLKWYDEKRRWRNEEVKLIPKSVKKQFPVAELGCIVKVEHILALTVGSDSCRIIYPYFAENPVLSEEAARVGLWLLSQAIPNYKKEDLRVLDILRGNSFGLTDYPLQGNEKDIFIKKYKRLLEKREELKKEKNK